MKELKAEASLDIHTCRGRVGQLEAHGTQGDKWIHVHTLPGMDWRCVMNWIPLIIPGQRCLQGLCRGGWDHSCLDINYERNSWSPSLRDKARDCRCLWKWQMPALRTLYVCENRFSCRRLRGRRMLPWSTHARVYLILLQGVCGSFRTRWRAVGSGASPVQTQQLGQRRGQAARSHKESLNLNFLSKQ